VEHDQSKDVQLRATLNGLENLRVLNQLELVSVRIQEVQLKETTLTCTFRIMTPPKDWVSFINESSSSEKVVPPRHYDKF
jgi:hypothetical protein